MTAQRTQSMLLSMAAVSCSWASPFTTARGNALVTGHSDTVVLREGLLIDGVGVYGRSPLHRDALEALIISGAWGEPHEGDTLQSADGVERTWRPITVDESGWFSDHEHRGGYIYVRVDSDEERIMLLHMMGNSMAYINGSPRVGSRYQYRDEVDPWEPGFKFVQLPIRLKRGRNDLLFRRAGRAAGRVKATLLEPEAEVLLNPDDVTVPDLLLGKAEHLVGSVVVINATPDLQDHLHLSVAGLGPRASTTSIPAVQPMSVRKVAFPLDYDGITPGDTGSQNLQLTLSRSANGAAANILHQQEITLGVKAPTETHKRTFVSHIDGSVQYYAVNPAAPLPGDTTPPALVLSLHGARVEAINQANSYAAKRWCNIVSPTNRRPYGFDWEDWGRVDALEVLALAKANLPHNPGNVYLTGHSMGGHGTWILGSMFPDQFAAIGPSAGWLSFWTYRGAKTPQHPGPVEGMLMRAELAGDTMAWAANLAPRGIYILHGADDDNVRPDQSHRMVDRLKEFHRDFVYHEEPGQGHWWDLSDEPGADCVDWAPMFDFFARHALPPDRAVRQVHFTTTNPGFSDACHWASIEDQTQHLKPSSISIRVDPGPRRFVGTTENVARMRLAVEVLAAAGPFSVELDGQVVKDIPYPGNGTQVWLEKRHGAWTVAEQPAATRKGPHRYGPFKAAFAHHMLFVYGTGGNEEENRSIRDKVRFDAEQWWFQGNGSVDVIADVDFTASDYPDRGVILYGNAGNNRAWDQLLAESPVQVTPGGVTIDGRALHGDDLACLFLRPRGDSDVACVAVVAGTGIRGLQLTHRLQYLFAGCNYPDFIVIGPDMLTDGASGVRAAGVFGSDWGVESGTCTWAEDRPPMVKEATDMLEDYIGPDPRPFVRPRGYVCYRADEPTRVDGKLDEASWDKAPWTEYHVDIEGKMRPDEPAYATRCKMLWDDRFFYVAAQLEDPHVWGTITQRNEVIFNDKDFEVFIDPDGDSHHYFEFEMNALNTVWNLFLDKPYKHGGTAVVREMPGQLSAVHVEGTLNDPTDTDRYWTVEIAFPWQAMAEFAGAACPPRDGEQWRVNFSRVQWGHNVVDGKYVRLPGKEEVTGDRHEDNWVWSPQGRINMHRPETWGYVQFSTRPVGSEVAFQPDPTAHMRYLLHKILYAQEAHVLAHGRYADRLGELELGELEAIHLSARSVAGPITLEITGDGWEAAGNVALDDGGIQQVRLRQDGKVDVP